MSAPPTVSALPGGLRLTVEDAPSHTDRKRIDDALDELDNLRVDATLRRWGIGRQLMAL